MLFTDHLRPAHAPQVLVVASKLATSRCSMCSPPQSLAVGM
jgi:hypothetical protein